MNLRTILESLSKSGVLIGPCTGSGTFLENARIALKPSNFAKWDSGEGLPVLSDLNLINSAFLESKSMSPKITAIGWLEMLGFFKKKWPESPESGKKLIKRHKMHFDRTFSGVRQTSPPESGTLQCITSQKRIRAQKHDTKALGQQIDSWKIQQRSLKLFRYVQVTNLSLVQFLVIAFDGHKGICTARSLRIF